MRFDGVGSSGNMTLGEFQAEIIVDGHSYSINVQVVSDTMLRHKLLIGTNFLNITDVNLRGGEITIRPLSEIVCNIAKCEDVLEILKIDVNNETCEINRVDVSHIKDFRQQKEIENLTNNYKPNKICESDVKMKLVLKDEEPVYQSARRLSIVEKEIVNAQIDEWIANGIAQPSTSDYASPIVLVRKKDDSFRLCVDYRL